MSFSRAFFQFIIVGSVLVFGACVEDKDYGEANNLRPDVNRNVSVNSNKKLADDSQETLGSLVNLPFEPVENDFRQEDIVAAGDSNRAPGPTDRRLIVVLRFSPEDTAKLIETISAKETPFDAEVEPEPWFPAELKAISETSGNQQLKGKGFGAGDFAKPPWGNGSLVKIEGTDYFVLTLQTS